MAVKDKSKEIAAAWLEINIQYLAPNKFYGPPGPLPGSKPQNSSFKPEYRHGPQRYETLTCLGKSWRSAI